MSGSKSMRKRRYINEPSIIESVEPGWKELQTMVGKLSNNSTRELTVNNYVEIFRTFDNLYFTGEIERQKNEKGLKFHFILIDNDSSTDLLNISYLDNLYFIEISKNLKTGEILNYMGTLCLYLRGLMVPNTPAKYFNEIVNNYKGKYNAGEFRVVSINNLGKSEYNDKDKFISLLYCLFGIGNNILNLLEQENVSKSVCDSEVTEQEDYVNRLRDELRIISSKIDKNEVISGSILGLLDECRSKILHDFGQENLTDLSVYQIYQEFVQVFPILQETNEKLQMEITEHRKSIPFISAVFLEKDKYGAVYFRKNKWYVFHDKKIEGPYSDLPDKQYSDFFIYKGFDVKLEKTDKEVLNLLMENQRRILPKHLMQIFKIFNKNLFNNKLEEDRIYFIDKRGNRDTNLYRISDHFIYNYPILETKIIGKDVPIESLPFVDDVNGILDMSKMILVTYLLYSKGIEIEKKNCMYKAIFNSDPRYNRILQYKSERNYTKLSKIFCDSDILLLPLFASETDYWLKQIIKIIQKDITGEIICEYGDINEKEELYNTFVTNLSRKLWTSYQRYLGISMSSEFGVIIDDNDCGKLVEMIDNCISKSRAIEQEINPKKIQEITMEKYDFYPELYDKLIKIYSFNKMYNVSEILQGIADENNELIVVKNDHLYLPDIFSFKALHFLTRISNKYNMILDEIVKIRGIQFKLIASIIKNNNNYICLFDYNKIRYKFSNKTNRIEQIRSGFTTDNEIFIQNATNKPIMWFYKRV